MRKLARWLFLVPLAIVLVLLAVANRAPVTLSLDPFSREARPSPSRCLCSWRCWPPLWSAW